MREESSRWVCPSVCMCVCHTFLQICKVYVRDVIMYLFSHHLALRFCWYSYTSNSNISNPGWIIHVCLVNVFQWGSFRDEYNFYNFPIIPRWMQLNSFIVSLLFNLTHNNGCLLHALMYPRLVLIELKCVSAYSLVLRGWGISILIRNYIKTAIFKWNLHIASETSKNFHSF